MLGALIGALGCGGSAQGKAAATPTTQTASTSVPAPRASVPAPRLAVPSDCRPLEPPPSRDLPEELKKALRQDSQGRPVIAQQGGVGLVYDSKLNDPIARWGACLSRVLAVKTANREPGNFARCIDLIEVCPTDEGGDNCCPQACIDKFKKQHAGGLAEKEALDASFTEGSCIKGFPSRAPR